MRRIYICLSALCIYWMPCAFAQSGDATGQIRRYLALSRQFEKEQPDSAVYYAGLGVTLAEKTKKETLLADLLLQLGEVNMRHHHTDLARQFYNKALGLFRRQHDAGGVARTYDALGLLDADSADFGRAMQYYRDSRDSSGIITTYIAMGKAAQQKGRQEQAISHYLRALAQYEHREHRPEAYYSLLETVGRLYEAKGDTATAMHYFRSGIRDSLQEGLPETAVHLMNAEGEILEQQHEEKKALAVYKQALAEARRQHQADEQAEALLHIAGILKQTDAKSSITDLKQALALAGKLRQPQLEARIYAALAAVYRQEKNYGEAMNALEEQHRLVDSLLRTDTVKEINALENSYALESSEEKVSNLQHINRLERWLLGCGALVVLVIAVFLVLLWRYLRKSRRLNAELRASNRVKDTLFSVIGHDLKGPAASAAQLFELMETEELPPDELKVMVRELRKQTAASLELLQALFEWGKAQLRGVTVQPVDFDPQPVVERCVHLLGQQAALKGIRIENNLPDNLLLHADANHFEFIIRNLLSNAIKFSYEGGVVAVGAKAEKQAPEVVFAVSDQGVGISNDQQAIFLTGNLKVSFGTQKEKGSGLGLLLTKDFVKANGGRIWLESEEGRGSTFFVAMPTAIK